MKLRVLLCLALAAAVVPAVLTRRAPAAPARPAPAPAAVPEPMTAERAIDILRLPAYAAEADLRAGDDSIAYAATATRHEVRFDEASPDVTVGDVSLSPMIGGFGPARATGGRVVYERPDMALVYAPSGSGVKEDLVLYRRSACSRCCAAGATAVRG